MPKTQIEIFKETIPQARDIKEQIKIESKVWFSEFEVDELKKKLKSEILVMCMNNHKTCSICNCNTLNCYYQKKKVIYCKDCFIDSVFDEVTKK